MKIIAVAIIPAFWFLTSCSSPTTKNNAFFEGRITYKNEYFVKTNHIDAAALEQQGGETAALYFKDGNYLEKYDSGYMLEQLYRQQENKIYIQFSNSDTLHWFSCSKPTQKMLRFEIHPKKETILGIPCDELITYYDNKTVSFYYNSDSLPANPEWYSNFTAYNKNVNARKMKAVYLKYKIERPDFIITVTATSISKQQIDDSIFSIPQGKVLIEDKQ